jgi:hypothetical protein
MTTTPSDIRRGRPILVGRSTANKKTRAAVVRVYEKAMKHIIPLTVLLLAGCATAPEKEEPPAGSPEALMELLGGGRPKAEVDLAKIEKHPLGSKENPVRVGGPGGQRAYLSRLRCEDGRFPEFERAGSVGTGPWGYIMDAYSLACASGQKATVFMDMYHSRHQEDRAVPGFTIEPLAAN